MWYGVVLMARVVTLVRRGGAVPLSLGLGEISAISLTRPDDAEAEGRLRALHRAGARRVVSLWDASLDETDYYGIAQVLAAAARAVGFDVLVCAEGSRGALGPAVAERLGVPHLSGVVAARLDGDRVIARRLAGGERRSYEAPTPLLLCVAPQPPLPVDAGPVDPGFTVERLSLASLGISSAELRWRRRFAPRPAPGPRARPLAFADVEALADRLAAEGAIGARPIPIAAPSVERASPEPAARDEELRQ